MSRVLDFLFYFCGLFALITGFIFWIGYFLFRPTSKNDHEFVQDGWRLSLGFGVPFVLVFAWVMTFHL